MGHSICKSLFFPEDLARILIYIERRFVSLKNYWSSTRHKKSFTFCNILYFDFTQICNCTILRNIITESRNCSRRLRFANSFKVCEFFAKEDVIFLFNSFRYSLFSFGEPGPESIKLFIEGKAFSRSYALAPPPPVSRERTRPATQGRLRKSDNLLTGEGGRKGMGMEPKHMTPRKPGPL